MIQEAEKRAQKILVHTAHDETCPSVRSWDAPCICDRPVRAMLAFRTEVLEEAAKVNVSDAQKAARLVSALQDIYPNTGAKIAEYRARIGGWSANEHDHLLIAALDTIARQCSHHLAGEPSRSLAASPQEAG